MPATPATESIALAHFKPLAGDDEGQSFPVHFNPASLQHTIANTQDPQRRNGAGVQFVSQTTAKLTMDLVFDTTLTGEDVREATDKMAKLLRPYQDGGGKVPPSVEFSWGTYTFTGIVEQYRETLDFFSAGGVPLRSSINLTLSSNAVVFESARNPNAAVDGQGAPEPVVLPDSAGPAAVAGALGDPRAARAIASVSGSASLRFGGGASLAVAGSVSLSSPAAFASGGAGIGIGAGIGVGVGIGGGVGLGVEATAGSAFAGLRAGGSAAAGSGVTSTRALLPAASAAGSGGAGFELGGAARARSGGSLNADVGASAGVSSRIGFQD
jgi:Contractile injection system tube protein